MLSGVLVTPAASAAQPSAGLLLGLPRHKMGRGLVQQVHCVYGQVHSKDVTVVAVVQQFVCMTACVVGPLWEAGLSHL